MLLFFSLDLQTILSFALTFIVIFTLESVLSIDNAAVLSLIINKLPENQRGKALTYGIWGAYLFRGLSILGVSWLLANPDYGAYLKILGGFYLLKLVYTHFTPEQDSTEEGDVSWLEKTLKGMGIVIPLFWLIVIEVEFLDFVFSIDNILACVAMSSNVCVIIFAVFLAILTMRFVIKKMSVLMEKYPYLENRAYIVIGLIALKLIFSAIATIFVWKTLESIFENHYSDLVFSVVTMLVFLPIFVPKKVYENPSTLTENITEEI